MFKLFKKTTFQPSSKPTAGFKGKTTNQIVEEIHETFYTEVDNLLASALQSNSLDTDKNELIEKCKRLRKLGFTNTQEVKEAEAEINRIEKIKLENEQKTSLIEAINYFSFKYPQYKFITQESVKIICQKYGLVYGITDRYVGTVPDKSLKQMEEFKIDEQDECYYISTYMDFFPRTMKPKTRFYNKESFLNETKRQDELRNTPSYHTDYFQGDKCPLEIAAPVKDFDMQGMEVKDYQILKIEIPDPVVLKPVFFNNKKYYLIVAAWGQEGLDENVVNDKMN